MMGFASMSEILVEPRGFDSMRHVQTDSLEISGSNAEPTNRPFYLWDFFFVVVVLLLHRSPSENNLATVFPASVYQRLNASLFFSPSKVPFNIHF